MHQSHKKLKELVQIERKTLKEILTHLKVINDKKIFTQMGYKSLLKYCVRELGYSESAAYRRIATLRLEKRIPQIKEEIENGGINLSTATTMKQLIDYKEKDSKERVDASNLMDLVRGKSTRDAEVLIREELKLEPKRKVVRIEMSEKSYAKWIEFKGRHIAKRMTDEALLNHAIAQSNQLEETKITRRYRKAAPQKKSSNPRYIQASVKREVRERARNRCQHPGCRATYALEIDHIVPVCKKGDGNIENLQLLCRNHNALKGWHSF